MSLVEKKAFVEIELKNSIKLSGNLVSMDTKMNLTLSNLQTEDVVKSPYFVSFYNSSFLSKKLLFEAIAFDTLVSLHL